MTSNEGTLVPERLPYHAPEVHEFGSIAEITAGGLGADNPYGGHGGSGHGLS
jgi:hypothetical protein